MIWIIILVAGLSLFAMIVKELFDVDASINDIVADFLGIFFGTGLAVVFMRLGERFFGIDDQPGSSGRISPDSPGDEPGNTPDSFTLSDSLCVGMIMTELGCRFYTDAIDKVKAFGYNVCSKRLWRKKKML